MRKNFKFSTLIIKNNEGSSREKRKLRGRGTRDEARRGEKRREERRDERKDEASQEESGRESRDERPRTRRAA